MADPPVPVLMLYDPEEFWEQVRKTVRDEMAAVHAGYNGFISALEKAGLPVKPAYTLRRGSPALWDFPTDPRRVGPPRPFSPHPHGHPVLCAIHRPHHPFPR
jgi:hypothetical protein